MLALVWLLVITTDAAAYLDPGAGSMVFQTIVAALAAVGYGVRLYWGKIKALFVKRASSPAEHDGGMNVQTKR